MDDCKKKGRNGGKMAVLATPKRNSYIVKKDSAQKIVNSKLSKSKQKTIHENAALFVKNNMTKGK